MNMNRTVKDFDGVMDCGGKRSATPLSRRRSPALRASQSGVVASLCHRSPKWFALALALVFLCAAIPLRALDSVERWGVYEVSLSGPTNGNPFTDVKFSARFQHETNSVEVAGFYDGDGVYRVRFMPETEGRWRYTTASSARALN